ncbi:MAG: hypothetical protein AAF899_04325 [Pseudomonadota bacterium]
MPRCLAAIAVMLLLGCSSPSPAFWGAEAVPVMRDGVRHDIYVSGGRVQLIRLGSTLGSTLSQPEAGLSALYVTLVGEATGCRVDRRTIDMDQSVMTARLICR